MSVVDPAKSKPPRVWLILEHHCYPPSEGLASVWISGRPLCPEKTLGEDVAQPLVGPLAYADAVRMIGIIQAELQVAGVEVITESAADD